jgi:hypothetical protein
MECDIILDIGHMPHKTRKAGGKGVNEFYGDGHVEFRNSPEAFGYIFNSTNRHISLDSFNRHPDFFLSS